MILNDSPDNTKLGDIVASYADERIRYTVNEKNMGITPSRNKLLKMAQGEYIAIFDHDDISEPNRLERQVAYLDAHPDVGVLGAGVREFPSGKEVHYPENDAEIRMGLMWGCMITHSAAMVRRDLLVKNNICYEEYFSPSEDYALWCRLIPYTRFHNLPEVLFRYRFHANNTSKSQADKMDRATYAIRAFAKADNPALYEEYLMRAEHTTRVRLFGCIPFLKIVSKGVRTRVYLFDCIPLYTAKTVIKMRG
ncbi:MAG: glycosyltransferase family 2 protein [Akkermansia sp.]|nr:glycosyltransferase family 2 protein [Akkermansia sp.]